ncbi:MAG TPA: histone deacetylase [Candidatus Sphingobacterium stercoripullorum]|nr:histone deacetylase [Candidatus Sphingobacterium stercoripullorum]
MLMIAHHPYFCHPLPAGHRFPMEKYDLLYQQLIYQGVVDDSQFFEPAKVAWDMLSLSHASEYIEHVLELNLDGKMVRRIGFPLSRQLVEREQHIVQGTILASHYALEYGVSFNSAGGTHHAGRDFGEGFCIFNDQAVAANSLLQSGGFKRIAIVDLDVHQGNGTAHIFDGSSQVFTLSMHAENNYPFKKEKSTLDIPLQDGLDDHAYLACLDENLKYLLETFKPEFVFYQAGVDVLATDKLGRLSLTMEGCRARDAMVFNALYKEGIPVQVSMGGGYSPNISDIVNAHIETYKQAIKIFKL